MYFYLLPKLYKFVDLSSFDLLLLFMLSCFNLLSFESNSLSKTSLLSLFIKLSYVNSFYDGSVTTFFPATFLSIPLWFDAKANFACGFTLITTPLFLGDSIVNPPTTIFFYFWSS